MHEGGKSNRIAVPGGIRRISSKGRRMSDVSLSDIGIFK